MAEHSFVTTQTGPPPTAPTGSAAERPRPVATAARGSRRIAIPDASIVVRPWITTEADRPAFDPRSRFVERCWLGVLGPSATWLLRRLTDELDAAAVRGHDRVSVDLVALARAMGLAYVPGRESPFAKAIQRCVMFDVAHHTGDGLAVRRRMPEVPERFLRRLPPAVTSEHDRWVPPRPPVRAHCNGTTEEPEVGRARRVAVALGETGLSPDGIEALLVHLGTDVEAAATVTDELRAVRPVTARDVSRTSAD